MHNEVSLFERAQQHEKREKRKKVEAVELPTDSRDDNNRSYSIPTFAKEHSHRRSKAHCENAGGIGFVCVVSTCLQSLCRQSFRLQI